MCPTLPGKDTKRVERDYQANTYLWAFEIALKTYEVAEESIQQEVVVSFCKASVDHNSWIYRRSKRIVGEWVGYASEGLERVSPSDAVRAWVHPDGILEASGGDLTIVVRVSPTTQSTYFVVVEHFRMLSIKGIWHAFF